MSTETRTFRALVNVKPRKWIRKAEWAGLVVTLYLLIAGILDGINRYERPTMIIVVAAAVVAYAIIVATIFLGAVHTRRDQRRERTIFKLSVDSFSADERDWGTTTLALSEIRCLVVQNQGTWLIGTEGTEMLIPVTTENYSKLVEELSKGRKVVQVSKPAGVMSTVAAAIFFVIVLASLMLMVFTSSQTVRYASGGAVVVALMFQYLLLPLLRSAGSISKG